jgi:hypothetical protein
MRAERLDGMHKPLRHMVEFRGLGERPVAHRVNRAVIPWLAEPSATM